MKDTSPTRIKFGLKCPGVLYRNDLSIYKRYFPTTKLIIGLRSPLSWFESFYNYQMTKSNPSIMKDTNTTNLIGMCKKHQKVCTHRARFHSAPRVRSRGRCRSLAPAHFGASRRRQNRVEELSKFLSARADAPPVGGHGLMRHANQLRHHRGERRLAQRR